jgi:hypothetical protein
MPLFLLLLGMLTTMVGLALVASGVTMRDAFETDVITPGAIAAVGGLLLIGMGLTIRELQRLAQAFAEQTFIRDARRDRLVNPADGVSGSVRHPFPSTPTANSNLNARPGPIAPVTEGRNSALRRRETADTEGSVSELGGVPAPSHAPNDVLVSPTTRRVSPNRSAAPNGAKAAVFRGFWPGNQRAEVRSPAVQDAPVSESPQRAAPVPADEGKSADAASLTDRGVAHESATPVSVLKSGMIEGMAYTLYSDGSIEAELPQGKLRFGSITALRDHIEGAA